MRPPKTRELDGEGPLSFARAFSIAGASATVASLWPVNDRATAQLMTRLRYRDRGIQPAEAPAAGDVGAGQRQATRKA